MQSNQNADSDCELVPLVRLKNVVRRPLPTTNMARSIILAGRISSPSKRQSPSFEIFDRLLTKELVRSAVQLT